LTKSGDIEEGLILKETRTRVRRVLAEIGGRDAEILRAVFLEEHSADLVCRSFGVDRAYLRVLLHRAKQKFRDEYLRTGAASSVDRERPSLPTPAAQRKFDIVCAAINEDLLDELRHQPKLMRELQPRRFEELVADMFARRGCKVKLTPATRDGGVDIYAVEHHAFGESLYLIECKRYGENRKVGVEPVRGLYAVTEAKRATRGILVTTSFFTNDAIAFASPLEYRLALRDFDALCEWLAAMKPGGAA
jgi:restriction endonuclease Mrr